MADGEIIKNIDLTLDTSKAEKSLSSYTRKILSAFKKANFTPFDNFLNDTKTVQAKIKEIQKNMDSLAASGKKVEIKMDANEIKDIQQNYKSLEKQIALIHEQRNAMGDINLLAKSQRTLYDDLTNQLTKLSIEQENYREIINSGFVKSETTIPGKSTEEYAEMTRQMQQYQQVLAELQSSTSWSEVAKSMNTEEIQKQIDDLTLKLKLLKAGVKQGWTGVDSDIKNYESALKGLNEELTRRKNEEENVKQKNTHNTNSKNTKTTNMLTKATNGLVNAIKKVGKAAVNIFKNTLSKAIQMPFKGVKKLSNGLLFMIKAGLGIRGLYMLFRKLRSYIQEGANTVASGNDTVKKSIATMSGALSQLKVSLGVIVAPLINALAPALAYVAQLATTAANAIARFFASLTGQKTVVQASINTQAYADALEDSADEAKKALGAYDKLNVIQDSSSSGSGSGSSGASGLIDTTSVNNEFAKMWENADFSELGKNLATKLRDSLLGIDWKGTIQPFAEKFAKSLTSFINGAISVPKLGKSIGSTIGNAVQTGIQFFYTLNTTLNWRGLGNTIAEALKGAIGAINPQMLADTLHSLLNGAIELLIGVFDPNNGTFAEFGTKVGQFIAGLFSEDNLSETKQNISTLWSDIKQSFDDFIQAFIQEVQESNPEIANLVLAIQGIGNAIVTVLQIAVDAVAWMTEHPVTAVILIVSAIAGLVLAFLKLKNMMTDVDGAVASAYRSFGSFLDKLGTATIIAAVAFALHELANVIDSVSNFFVVCGQNSDTFADSLLGLNLTLVVITATLIALAVVFDTFKIGAVILIAVIAAIALAITALGEAMPPISEGIETINNSFGDLAETIGGVVTKVIEAIGDALAKPIDSCQKLFDTCSDTLPTIIADLTEFIKKVKGGTDELKEFAKQSKSTWDSASKDVNTYSTNVTNTLSKLQTSVTTLSNSMKTTFTTMWSNIGTSTTTSLNTMVTTINKALSTIKTNMTTNISGIKTVLSELKSYVSTMFNDSASVFNNYGDGFRQLLNRMIGYAQSFVNAIASAMDAVAQSINNMNIKIPSWVPSYGGKSWRPSVSGGVRVSIPRLAQGAVLPPNQPFLAMLGDQKQGTNVEAPLDTIVQAMQQALSSGVSGTKQPIVLQLDGKTVAKVVWDENKKRYKQTGKAYSY